MMRVALTALRLLANTYGASSCGSCACTCVSSVRAQMVVMEGYSIHDSWFVARLNLISMYTVFRTQCEVHGVGRNKAHDADMI
eukprot:2402058-Lingulodinium_polyedra.AAC.1